MPICAPVSFVSLIYTLSKLKGANKIYTAKKASFHHYSEF